MYTSKAIVMPFRKVFNELALCIVANNALIMAAMMPNASLVQYISTSGLT